MAQITARQRRIARKLARQIYIEHGPDLARAEEAFKANKQVSGLDPATIIFLIQIALKLWKWWAAKGVTIPNESWDEDEQD